MSGFRKENDNRTRKIGSLSKDGGNGKVDARKQ